MTESLEILINGEGKDLNLLNNHNLVYCGPRNLPQLVPTTTIFCLLLEMVFNGVNWAILQLLSFAGFLPYIQEVYTYN